MDFNEYRKLSQVERNNLETTTTDAEELATLEELKQQFEIEMKNEIEAFKTDNEKVDQIVNSVNLENQETIDAIKTEIGLDEKLKEMDSEAEKLLNNQEEGEDLLELEIKKEIDPMLKILCPEGESFDNYREANIEDLIHAIDIRNNPTGRAPQILSAEEMVVQMKELLHSRLIAITKDIKDDERKKKPGDDLVRKARIALLQERDFSDASSYFKAGDDGIIKYMHGEYVFQDAFSYLSKYTNEKKRMTEKELDLLVKTNAFPLERSSTYRMEEYVEAVPESLLLKIAQTADSNYSNIEYILNKFPSVQPYSLECAKQMVANGYAKTVFGGIEKFDKSAISEVAQSGQLDISVAIRAFKDTPLSEEEKGKYLDELVHNNNVSEYDLSKDEIKLRYADVIEKIKDLRKPWFDEVFQRNSWDIEPDNMISGKIEGTKNFIKEGRIGFLGTESKLRKYLRIIAETDHDWLINQLKEQNQEHLGLEFLNDSERVEYAQKLIDQGREYMLVKFIQQDIFPKGSFDQSVFDKLKEKDLIPALIKHRYNVGSQYNLSSFKGLDISEASRVIKNNKVSYFLDNMISFNIPEGYLQSPEVQEAVFDRLRDELMGYAPQNAKTVLAQIPLPKERADKLIQDIVRIKLIDNDRVDQAASIIEQFPYISEILQDQEIQDAAIMNLKKSFEDAYIYRTLQILRSFILPREQINTDVMKDMCIEGLKKDILHIKDFNAEEIKKYKDNIQGISTYIDLPEYFTKHTETLIGLGKAIKESPSPELQRVQSQVLGLVIMNENPTEAFSKVEDIFVKNNTPHYLKSFRIFDILHSDDNLKHKLKNSPSVAFKKLADTPEVGRKFILNELKDINMRTLNPSLMSFARLFEGAVDTIRKAESQGWESLSFSELEHITHAFNKVIATKDHEEFSENRFDGNEIKDLPIDQAYQIIRKEYNLTESQNLSDVLESIVFEDGTTGNMSIMERMDQYRKEADHRNRENASEIIKGRFGFKEGDLVKNVDRGYIQNIIDNGSVAKEFLGSGSASDSTPLDTDIAAVLSNDNGKEALSLATGYGDTRLIIKNNSAMFNKRELMYAGGVKGTHAGIRTGFPFTDVDVIMCDNAQGVKDIEVRLAEKGYYVPIVDNNFNLLGTIESYEKIREQFKGVDRFFAGSLVVNTEASSYLQDSLEDVRQNPEDARALENVRISAISQFEKIFAGQGISVNTPFEHNIAGVEIFETGSSSRKTNADKAFDFDFAIRMDVNLMRNLSPIEAEISKQMKYDKVEIYTRNQTQQRRYFGVTKIGGITLPAPVDLDIAFTPKNQPTIYGSHDAVIDRFEHIKNNQGENALEFVQSNIRLAKKILKENGLYKKTEGFMGGITIENWILQNNGNIIDAMRSFISAAKDNLGDIVSPEDFWEQYPILDPGLNIDFGRHDSLSRQIKSKENLSALTTFFENYLNKVI